MAAVVLTQEIMTRETAQTNHATPTHPRRASLVTQSAKSRIEMLAPQPLHFRNVRLCYIAYTSSASLGGTRDVAANAMTNCYASLLLA